MDFIIEKKIFCGKFLCEIILIENSYRCGYIAVDKDHFLYKIDYLKIASEIEVHGGLTFSGRRGSDLWWFGYDCNHVGDKSIFDTEGEERTLDYCIDECKKLAVQFDNIENTSFHYYILSTKQKLSEEMQNKMICWSLNNDFYAKKYIIEVKK